MSEAVLSLIGSIVVGLLSFLGIWYTSNSNRKAYEAVNDEKMKQISGKIDALEVKQDKHNSVIERTFILEKQNAEQNRDIKTLFNNINEMKDDIKDVKEEVEEVKGSVHKIEIGETRLEEKLIKD